MNQRMGRMNCDVLRGGSGKGGGVEFRRGWERYRAVPFTYRKRIMYGLYEKRVCLD